MTEEKKRHWREGGNLTHFGVAHLPNGNDIPYIMIKEIVWEENVNVGGKPKSGFFAVFEENPYCNLKMSLNYTNKMRLLKMAEVGEYELDTIKNLPVRLTAELTKSASGGPKVLGLRISKLPPEMPVLPELTKESEVWQQWADYMKNGGDINVAKASFTITPEIEKELTNGK